MLTPRHNPFAGRALKPEEIEVLQLQGCQAQDWARVRVAPTFSPKQVFASTFLGDCYLGHFDAHPLWGDEPPRMPGVANCVLCDCIVEDNACLHSVQSLKNIHIESEAMVAQVLKYVTTKDARRGEGATVEPVVEAGGRPVRIYRGLSAQTAWLQAFLPHRAEVREGLAALIEAHVARRRRGKALVGAGARVEACADLVDVDVGPGARIRGASTLADVAVDSRPDAPATIGHGVMLAHAVCAPGSVVDGAAEGRHVFVGEGARLGRGFHAEQSLFFANCEGFQGEACAIFAGPYTVTHHKATLLLTALYSFYNAGSGTNSSNHRYKLGPVHQGVLERGAKTGSGSYTLWPSRIGAFTSVLGKHGRGFDAGDLPFSLILEAGGESLIVPGANLFTAGVYRDARKWAARDRRPETARGDRIRFDMLTPAIAEAMLRGVERLTALQETARGAERVACEGLLLPTARIEKALDAYSAGLERFALERLLARIEALANETDLTLDRLLQADPGDGPWLDLAGMLCPTPALEEVLATLGAGGYADLTAFEEALDGLHAHYGEFAWDWTRQHWDALVGGALEEWSDIHAAVEQWPNCVADWNERVLRDAEKEYAPAMRIGYGLDGKVEEDFAAVRGAFEHDPVVAALRAETEAATARAEQVLSLLP